MSTAYPASASRLPMARKPGRRPKMSGHTSTAAVAAAGCTKCASQVPSGVLISTSDSETSAADATAGSIAASVAPNPKAPNRRRETSLPRRISSLESRSHMTDPKEERSGDGFYRSPQLPPSASGS